MNYSDIQIIHIDMDAFYASVEVRDNPWLRGQPVIVGGISDRGVVSAASYEARKFGVHSAMPMKTARRICPEGVFLKTRINYYKEVSRQIRRILDEYTDLIEPLSLDECYLDVTRNFKNLVTGFEVARDIKRQIKSRLDLTASAGVAPCKFIAKIASDLEKPDGLVVVRPDEIEAFLSALSIDRIPGVGEVMTRRLSGMGVQTIGELRDLPLDVLEQQFGRFGLRLWEMARGVDTRPVNPEQESKSLSHEETFDIDTLDLNLLRGTIEQHADSLARRLAAKGVLARTVTLKVKYADFSSVTRRVTHDSYFRSSQVIRDQGWDLLARTAAGDRPVRLVGVGVSQFWNDEQGQQLSLFDIDGQSANDAETEE